MEFLREQDGELYSRIQLYSGPKVVGLCGTVHIGMRSYYDSLKDRLKQFDHLLVEGISHDSTESPIGAMAFNKIYEKIADEFQGSSRLTHQGDWVYNFHENYEQCDFTKAETEAYFVLNPKAQHALQTISEDLITYLDSHTFTREQIIQAFMMDDDSFPTHLQIQREAKVTSRLSELECSVGILYGVEHMPRFDEHLQSNGYTPTTHEWLKVL